MGSISPRSHYAIDVVFEVVSTATDTEYRHNIMADGQVIAVHAINGNGAASTSYLHYDHLGSVDAITDDQGNVIQTMSFDAYGLRRDAANWDYDLSQNQIATLKNYTDRGYTDQEQLDNLSLVDMNGRVYDPTVGRMISADPTVPDAFFSQAFNRFAYVYDSPLEYTDPSGFIALAPCSGTTSEGSEPSDGVLHLRKVCVTAYLIYPAGYGGFSPGFLSFLFPGWGNGSYLPSPPTPGSSGSTGGSGPGSHGSAKPPTNATQPQQQPQPPKQQTKQNCDQNRVDQLNHDYAFGEGMIKAGLTGAAGAAIIAEIPTPQTEVFAGSLALVSAGEGIVGIGMQGAAGWELYKQTGDITPFRNSVVGFAQSLASLPPVANLFAATAMSTALGSQQATCPNQ